MIATLSDQLGQSQKARETASIDLQNMQQEIQDVIEAAETFEKETQAS